MKALDVALLLTFATLLAFVSGVFICNVKGIQIQDSLITAFLAIIATELLTCGGITAFKNLKKKKKQEDTTNEN